MPSLVVGAAVNAPLSPIQRARVARELLAVMRGTTVIRSRDEMTISAIVIAACKLAEMPVDHPPYAVLAEVERMLGKAIARKTRKALPEVCAAVRERGADARGWLKRATASHDRIAAVASGDVSAVLRDALSVPPGALPHAVQGNGRAEELLAFVLSPVYLEVRRALGLEDAA
jgi:hypothetical protein